jgi:hypothetical protein
MIKIKLHSVVVAAVVSCMLALPATNTFAGGGQAKDGSEVIVQRVDNNSLIRLRVYIDARPAGSLRVGETSTFKIKNGPHTIRAAFEDYQARSTEVTQFNAHNSRHFFTVTDESIVSVKQEQLRDTPMSPAVQSPVVSSDDTMSEGVYNIDASIRSSFDVATKDVKKKKKIVIINVDADNDTEGNYILEELTYLSVQSPKQYVVIDRRKIDAFRTKNSIGIPSYENDFQLLSLGQLMGADVVISGRLDGPGDYRRLRVKALDVSTGHLIGDSSERI